MKLKEVLPVIDSAIVLEIACKKETYKSKSTIPEERMGRNVESIQPGDKNILIVLGGPQKTETLEELGYSFEVGM